MKIPPKYKKHPSSCDWKMPPVGDVGGVPANITRRFKYRGNYSWHGIRVEKYKTAGDEWSGVIRQTLIGGPNEPVKFHVRYFEIAPNGFSSYEVHKHEHVVIGIRGRGICLAGTKKFTIGFLDTVYIKSREPHQFINTYDEPFGFLCVVNAKRDKPKVIKQ